MISINFKLNLFTHFSPMFHFYIPRKKSENQMFSDIFRGYKNGAMD